jgi:hypothetical protein
MSHRLQILVTEHLHAKILKDSQRRRLSKGEWVRRAIERTLAEDVASGDPLSRLARLEGPTADIAQMLAEIEAGRS